MTAEAKTREDSCRSNEDQEARFGHVVCCQCGCLCDDIGIAEGGDGRISAVTNACERGSEWLESRPPVGSSAVGRGNRELALEEAIERAVGLIVDSGSPAVAGLNCLTVESQRTVIHLAELLRCPVLPLPGPLAGERRSGLLAPELSASLDEVRASADLVIFWRADPGVSHPRHLERYSGLSLSAPLAPQLSRTVIVVDQRRGAAPGKKTESAATGDTATIFLDDLPEGANLHVDVALVLAIRQTIEKRYCEAAKRVVSLGLSTATVHTLATHIEAAKRVQLFLGFEAGNAAALWDEFQLLGAHLHGTHCFGVAALPPPWNSRGAIEAISWQTGLPPPLDFVSDGAPKHRPDIFNDRTVLLPENCDLLLAVGFDPAGVEVGLVDMIRSLRRIHLGHQVDPDAEVSFVVPGLDPRIRGRVIRSDGAVLWLSGSRQGAHPDPAAEILKELLWACQERR